MIKDGKRRTRWGRDEQQNCEAQRTVAKSKIQQLLNGRPVHFYIADCMRWLSRMHVDEVVEQKPEHKPTAAMISQTWSHLQSRGSWGTDGSWGTVTPAQASAKPRIACVLLIVVFCESQGDTGNW